MSNRRHEPTPAAGPVDRPSRGRRVRSRSIGAACAAGAIALVAVLAFGPGGCKPKPEDQLVILFSGNNDGVLAACGCPSNPSGGLAKREGLIDQYRRTRDRLVLIDAGNLFPGRENEVKVRYLAEAVAREGYDAIALGVAEFLLGPARLRELRAKYDLPFICANVREAGGAEIAPPHIVRERAGLKIGIFAVIGDWTYGFPPLKWREGLEVEDPVRAARREAEALASCDLVIAVSHMPLPDTRRLAAEVPGLDVVIAGHEPVILKEAERVGDALLVAAGPAGNFLGALYLWPGKDGTIEHRLDMTTLSAQVPDSKWVMDLYWKYVEEAKDKPPPDWELTPIPTRYDSAEACGKCHEAEYKQWKGTAHARAYESIKKAGRNRDPECVLCHTMGFGREGGFVSMEKTPALGRVTCQGCHIVTTDHQEKGVKPEPDINISSRLCMSCHGPIQSPDFDYFVYKPRILHKPPKGSGTAGE